MIRLKAATLAFVLIVVATCAPSRAGATSAYKRRSAQFPAVVGVGHRLDVSVSVPPGMQGAGLFLQQHVAKRWVTRAHRRAGHAKTVVLTWAPGAAGTLVMRIDVTRAGRNVWISKDVRVAVRAAAPGGAAGTGCPAGDLGSPPRCVTPVPTTCRPGQTVSPPNCLTPIAPSCPAGQVGAPPTCETPPPNPGRGDTLSSGETLQPGWYLESSDGDYQLVMQASDGNLVLYHEGKALWASGAQGAGAYLAMQGDGSLVIYDGREPKWSSNTAGYAGAYLQVQNDNNVVIYQGATALWDWASGRLSGGGGGNQGEAIVAASASQAGLPYCWDGGNEHGPNHGSGNQEGATQCGPQSVVGFDCTGLTQYAAYQGTGGAVDLTHHNSEQAEYAPGRWITGEAALEPGDIVYFGYNRNDITHAAIYAGVVNGQQMIWDANIAFWIYPDGVHERTLASENGLGFVGAARVWH
jgi:NlpC/P60 family